MKQRRVTADLINEIKLKIPDKNVRVRINCFHDRESENLANAIRQKLIELGYFDPWLARFQDVDGFDDVVINYNAGESDAEIHVQPASNVEEGQA
jgi:hypothetical protein